ncbi:MAG: hypothetical protein AAFX01_07890 [Cyanobacteria bacterium J06638_28]
MTSLNPSPRKQYPLSVVLTSSGIDAVVPGSRLELGITVHNIGDRSSIVYVFIEERSPVLRQWCGSMQERLALAPDQSGEVTFQIDVPPAALPEILEYDLVVDGSDSYQDFPPRRYDHYQLQVLPAARVVGGAEEPTFYLEPGSTSNQPLIVQPGIPQALQVWVDNRAERVDRFRLKYIGVPTDWQVTITYPKDTEGLGLVVEADSLGLNPGDRGQILMTVTAPINVLAGIYVPTLRVISANQPDMNLLDLVYLQVNPIYQLQPLLQILRNQVRRQPALFEIQLDNLGNTPRIVQLLVEHLDEPDSCAYMLETEAITLPPQTVQRVLVEGVPQKWWQRPLFGGGRFFNFRVNLQDAEAHPLPINTLPSNLLWLPRPWWQLLLLLLTLLGIIGALVWLIWWLFFKPPVLPQLITFEVADSRYAQANNEFARVNWEIDNFHRVAALTLTGTSPEGEIISTPLTFNFDGRSLPQALIPFCTEQARQLTCTNVRTNASRPGTYTFNLAVRPKGRRPKRPITAESSPVVIDPRPLILPEITDFLPSRLTYQEPGPVSDDEQAALPDNLIDPTGIPLNWLVTNPSEVAGLRLIARGEDDKLLGELRFPLEQSPTGEISLPESLQDFCQLTVSALVCRDVPTGIFQVGTYTFELIVVARTAPEAEADSEPISVITEAITIQPAAPVIAQFQINGQDVQPKYLIPVSKGAPPPIITLTWQILGGATTTAELTPVPGPVPLAGGTALPLNPQGNTLITLQATNQAGDAVTRSVQIETFDPNPEDPAAAAAAAAAAATANAAAEQDAAAAQAGSGDNGGSSSRPTADPDIISPTDVPPRFD